MLERLTALNFIIFLYFELSPPGLKIAYSSQWCDSGNAANVDMRWDQVAAYLLFTWVRVGCNGRSRNSGLENGVACQGVDL